MEMLNVENNEYMDLDNNEYTQKVKKVYRKYLMDSQVYGVSIPQEKIVAQLQSLKESFHLMLNESRADYLCCVSFINEVEKLYELADRYSHDLIAIYTSSMISDMYDELLVTKKPERDGIGLNIKMQKKKLELCKLYNEKARLKKQIKDAKGKYSDQYNHMLQIKMELLDEQIEEADAEYSSMFPIAFEEDEFVR